MRFVVEMVMYFDAASIEQARTYCDRIERKLADDFHFEQFTSFVDGLSETDDD